METIPPIFWMIIVGVLTIMTCLIMYHIAMLIKEAKVTIVESREAIKRANKLLLQAELIVDDLKSSVATIRGTVEEVNQSVIAPIRKIAYGVTMATAFINGLGKKKQEEKEEA